MEDDELLEREKKRKKEFFQRFCQNIGIHDLNFSENIFFKVVRHSFCKTSQGFSLLQFDLLQLLSLEGLENKFEMCMFEIAGLDCNI